MSRQVWKTTMMALLTAAAFSTVQAVPPEGGGDSKHAEMKDRLLKKFDADGDGKLSDTERAALKADREAMLAKYDTDKDGKLSDAEREAIPKPDKKPGPKK
jgi:Ca2+-binding EF-hand superfamily protein